MKDYFLNWSFILRRYKEIMLHSMSSYWFYHISFMLLILAVNVLTVYVPARVVQLLEVQASPGRILLSVAALGLSALCSQVLNPLRFFSGMEFRCIDLQLSSCFMMGISSEFMNGPKGAEAVENISHVLYRGNDYGTEGMMRQSWDCLTSLLILIVYFLFSVRLPWYWMLLLLFPSLIRAIVTHRYNQFHKQLQEKEMEIYYESNYCDQKIWSQSCAKDIRLYSLKQLFSDKLDALRKRSLKLEKKDQLWLRGRDALGLSLNLLRDLAGALILLRAFENQRISISQLVLFLGIMLSVSRQVDELINNAGSAINNSQQVTPYRKLFTLPQYDEGDYPAHLPEGSLALRFDDVSFSYGDKPLFEHFNLSIPAGEHVALVGNNGAGKTTLVKLACGLLTPASGTISLNGIDLQKVNPRERYRRVAMVFQELDIFASSLAENISLQPMESTDPERLEAAIDASGLRFDLEKLPHGLATEMTSYLHPEGIQFSGGQTQRLMLARALYKTGDLLILDEPTSALDPLAEAAMYREYKKFTEDKTAIFISHRLSSTQFCDRVLFLEDGKLVQDGSHESLLREEGPYRTMFETQAQYYRETPDENLSLDELLERKEEKEAAAYV